MINDIITLFINCAKLFCLEKKYAKFDYYQIWVHFKISNEKILLQYTMGRNNAKNIKTHNDKLHKAQDKDKAKKMAREEKLKAIVKKFNEDNAKQ